MVPDFWPFRIRSYSSIALLSYPGPTLPTPPVTHTAIAAASTSLFPTLTAPSRVYACYKWALNQASPTSPSHPSFPTLTAPLRVLAIRGSGFTHVTLTGTIVTMTTRILPHTGLSTFSVLGLKFNMKVKSCSEAEKKTEAAARRTASYKNRSLHVVHTGSTMVSTGSKLFENIN